MNIGIDFHDTLSYSPEFFKRLMTNWRGKVFIVTGTPLSRIEEVRVALRELGIHEELYHEILCGYEYEKKEMTLEHFHRMAKHKHSLVEGYQISVFFDDNPFYADYLKDKGVVVFQTIINKKYLEAFAEKDPFFTCNLQSKQFEFLEDLSDVEMLKENQES